jgi:biotin carboxylase
MASPYQRTHRASRKGRASISRALILDPGGTIGTPVCRILARQGCRVDVLAKPHAPIFYSRFVHERFISPPPERSEAFQAALQSVVEQDWYDEIYVCSEEVLTGIDALRQGKSWRGLLLPESSSLAIALSKNSVTEYLGQAGVLVPRTVVPHAEYQLNDIARELGFPLMVKGERGESGQHVRIASSLNELARIYHEIRNAEQSYGGMPALQEFIPGNGYSVGGLFNQGACLRVCAHRRLLMYPPQGGVTVRGVTARSPELLEQAFSVFKALHYTGLGHAEFIKDSRTGKFKFIEINPRIWGSITLSWYAGVDFFSAYRRLVKRLPVEADLRYRENVYFHRFSKDLRLLREQPRRALGFLVDSFNPSLKSDFEWLDPGPHLAPILNETLRAVLGRN